ncbi:DUF1453 family protein [Kibdelosporangium philippinense]|uniref:DUF1453 family protein n=1 Tax=Kibdelosporangium philippinense TaxID=211113 RepID=A0ABS8ZIB1_9PSEU|nr:CcdC protein domain-containing protein [Kibdelosporangium philippinense]MCE7007544.1 DUF1453 family protein [Kibdelosporangium philippinense]
MWVTVIVIALVIGVIVKRFLGEPLNARDVFVPPVVLTGIGVYHLVKDVHPTGGEIAWIVVAALVGLGFGAIRGLTPRLYAKEGHLWQRYTVWTLAVWVTSIVVNFGIGFLATTAGVPTEARPMTLSIGVSLLGEAITLGGRALKMNVPFTPEQDILDRIKSRIR